jgi:hypothetical protein
MKAIQFSKEADQIIHLRFGESQFKKVDDFWFDFTIDGVKTTSFAANLVPDTPENRMALDEIIENSRKQKAANDEFEKNFYRLLNTIKR